MKNLARIFACMLPLLFFTFPIKGEKGTDFDPLTNLKITIEIKCIRSLDYGKWYLPKLKWMFPDLYVKVFVNGIEFRSPVWHNVRYMEDQLWKFTCDIPDDQEWVHIKIELWDWNKRKDKLLDIGSIKEPEKRYAEIYYNVKSGHWLGDDWLSSAKALSDPSGYGRLNGCDDGSTYEKDGDFELCFDIYQEDYDGDHIPYWAEVNVFGTDPFTNDGEIDHDGDGVSSYWEWKWGHTFKYDHKEGRYIDEWFYHPKRPENHSLLDPDNDGLNNIEECLLSPFGTDPFRKDIFLEIDQMEKEKGSGEAILPPLTKCLLEEAFSRHNIVIHINEGWDGGGEIIPYSNRTSREDLKNIYLNYFMHGDLCKWKRGVMHYGVIVHDTGWPGYVYPTSIDGEHYQLDSFQISADAVENLSRKFHFIAGFLRKGFDRDYQRAVAYASVIMHELGHTLGIFNWNTPGCDNIYTVFPRKEWWKYRVYRSCMNYNYVYILVDYSDGSRGKYDFDDWHRIDFTFFKREF